MLLMAFDLCNQQNYLTEAFVLIYMLETEELKMTAMVQYIRQNNLIEMLIEGTSKITLNFEINKEISLRQFVGDAMFTSLVKRAVEQIGDQDHETCICLLDKIQETEQVLRTLIALQWSHI